MNWLTITPTTIELELDGATPLALLESLLDKLTASPLPGFVVEYIGAGEIFRLDGNLYDQVEYRITTITPAPELPLDIGEIV